MNKALGTGSIDRSARVRRIKRVIIGLICLAIILPTVLCILLFVKLNKLEKQLIELSYMKETVNVVVGDTKVIEPIESEPVANIVDSKVLYMSEETSDSIATEDTSLEHENDESIVVKEDVNDDNVSEDDESEGSDINDSASDESDDNEIKLKRVYLSFDDGPSSNTKKILDILKEKDVKASFFVVGRLSDTTTPMYKRIVDEGHTIGMHSYTHVYKDIYSSTDSFEYDLDRVQALIFEQTGVLSKYYRFPGGSSNGIAGSRISEYKQILLNRGIKYYDWNVSSGDATSRYGLSKNEIISRCINGSRGKEEIMILMHDLPEKSTTVQALPEIIDYFKKIGAEIVPIDENCSQFSQTLDLND